MTSTATERCDAQCACEAAASPLPADRRAYLGRALLLASITVGWNVLEGIVAVGAGLAAASVALVGFGADSFIEVLSGAIMVWRLRAEASGRATNEEAERRAIRLIAVTFFILAAYVALESGRDLLGVEPPEASPIGLALTAISLVVMPWLARRKRLLAREMGSASLAADSAQTQLCVYLSMIVFVGLALNATLGWWWADSVAALAIAGVAVREGYEAWTKQDLCEC